MLTWLSGFFMNPVLAAGALGVASPILIHFLSRRKFRRVRWAAMDFLLDALKKNRRRVRMEQIILLTLRCLAVLLIAMMVARPFLSRGSLASLLGASPRSERIIVVDDSFSMAARVGSGESAFDRAMNATRRLVELLAAESPQDSIAIWLTSNRSQPLVAAPRLDGESARRVHDALEIAKPSHRTAQFDAAFDAVNQSLRAAAGQANAVVYVVSDFQRSDWATDDSSRAPTPASVALIRLAAPPRQTEFVLIDVTTTTPSNLALVELRAVQPQVVSGVPARFEAVVANFSSDDASDLELSLSLADQVIPPVHLGRLTAGEVRREPIEITFPLAGSCLLSGQIVGDAARDSLALDDRRMAAVDVQAAVNVLLVDGEPSGDPFKDEVYLLRTALRPAGRAASGNDITVVSEADLDGIDLSSFHVVVLANVVRLSAAGRAQLETFLRAGGGVLVAAGRQLDIDWYNESLYRNGEGWLPMPFGEQVESAAAGSALHPHEWEVGHPALRAFVDPLADALRQVQFDAFIRLNEAGTAKPITASQPGATSAPDQPAPRVLIRLDDEARSPLLVERRVGRGTCVVLASTLDQDWNNWASSFSYVPIMLELVQHIARPPQALFQSSVGQPLVFPVDPARYSDTAAVRGPEYPVTAEWPIRARATEHGALFEFDQTDRAGAYEVIFSTKSGQSQSRRACVNLDPRESNLGPVNREQLQAALPDVRFTLVQDIDSLMADNQTLRTEMWWPLLLMAVAVLMAEQSLAWWFGTRG